MSTDPFAAIGAALVDAPSAWLAESAIAAALGWTAGELAPAIAGLVAGGLLERWDRPDGPVVTLRPLGASQLGVRVVEIPGAELYRWSADAASVRSARPSRRQLERTEDHAAILREIPDRRPGPTIDDAPKPRVLLWGTALWPWDERARDRSVETRCLDCIPRRRRRKHAPPVIAAACRRCGFGVRQRPELEHCPACHGARLPASWYCLRCDRWGMDGYFRRRGFGPPARRPKPRRKAG